MKKTLFCDKDGTLGIFGPGGKGPFPKVPGFLRRQKEKGREYLLLHMLRRLVKRP